MLALFLAFAAPAPATTDLIVRDSKSDFATTVRQLEVAVVARKLTLFGTVDHSEGAAKAGLELPPIKVLMIGNPQLGTPLMRAAPATAIELPQRIAVYQTPGGTVHVAYQNPAAIVRRHGVTGQDDFVAKASAALDALATEATR